MSDTQNPGGWPDAARPGVPMEPGISRPHWVGCNAMLWVPFKVSGGWCLFGAGGGYMTPAWAAKLSYLGPCLTPAEVAAREAAARREGIEAAAKEVDCGCDIRDAVLERLEAQGQKRASYLCQHGDVCCALQAAAIRALLEGGR